MRGITRAGVAAASLAVVCLLTSCFPQPPAGDTDAPVLSLPASFAVVAAGPGGADVGWTATANDAVDGPVPVTCTPPQGTFPIGTTRVTCTAADAAGNRASGSFDVTVTTQDLTPPVLSIPTGITAEATSPSGAAVTWIATATDDVDGDTPAECTPVPGVFPVGVTTVSCNAVDAAGNTATGTFDVSVVDTTAPTLTLPSEVTVAASSPTGAAVTWLATATDLVGGDLPVTCDPAPGQFPVGTTPVSCSATDAAGNAASGTFDVTVDFVDDAPPTLGLPTGITAEATGPDGAPVTWTATATDAIDGALTPSCTPVPGTFPLGTTTVSCSATDAAGNTATGSFAVGVVDTTAPTLALPGDITATAPDESGAQITWTASATDLVDGSVAVTCDPAPGQFAVGVTEVPCSATDAAGNAASGTFTVTVTVDPGPAATRSTSSPTTRSAPASPEARSRGSSSRLASGRTSSGPSSAVRSPPASRSAPADCSRERRRHPVSGRSTSRPPRRAPPGRRPDGRCDRTARVVGLRDQRADQRPVPGDVDLGPCPQRLARRGGFRQRQGMVARARWFCAGHRLSHSDGARVGRRWARPAGHVPLALAWADRAWPLAHDRGSHCRRGRDRCQLVQVRPLGPHQRPAGQDRHSAAAATLGNPPEYRWRLLGRRE